MVLSPQATEEPHGHHLLGTSTSQRARVRQDQPLQLFILSPYEEGVRAECGGGARGCANPEALPLSLRPSRSK